MTVDAGKVTAKLLSEFPHALRDGQLVATSSLRSTCRPAWRWPPQLLARWEHPVRSGRSAPGAVFARSPSGLGLMRDSPSGCSGRRSSSTGPGQRTGGPSRSRSTSGPIARPTPIFPAVVAQLLRRGAGARSDARARGERGDRDDGREPGFFAQLCRVRDPVSLDDFGTGFASLESLGGWPINELKLDRSIGRPIVAAQASGRSLAPPSTSLTSWASRWSPRGSSPRPSVPSCRPLGATSARDSSSAANAGRRLHRLAARPGDRLVPAWRVRLPAGGPRSAGRPGRRQASTGLGQAVRALRRAVQQVGGRTLASAAVLLVGLRAVAGIPLGRARHQALIGDLAFVPLNGGARCSPGGVAARSELGRRTCRAWRRALCRAALYLLGDVLQLGVRGRAAPGGLLRPGPTRLPELLCGRLLRPGRLPAARGRAERLRLLLDMGRCSPAGGCSSGTWRWARPGVVRPALRPVDLATFAYPVGTCCCCSAS